jgi:hypothetical protein
MCEQRNVPLQPFLSNVNITFSSIQSALFPNSSTKLFEPHHLLKPRMHLEVSQSSVSGQPACRFNLGHGNNQASAARPSDT